MKRRPDFLTSVIQELLERIEKDIKDEITINQLSDISGYSRWHLQRVFKSHTGVSLGTYIRQKKVEHAANDLLKERTSIIDVVVDYNFSSQSAFCRIFKTVYGVTLAAYRSIHKSVH
ncbi:MULTISPECIES: helix-turn-helix transcriptional regulator [Enterobacteriaceae]|uniref:helix-turn-helix transcriptional regulator n=1 Tax=Enterobacteriaceae TaxID=543 RepID=UPI0006A5FDD2|nr:MULTISPECIES: AraC family transcriptional regulator [Enterobacteriaceae]EKS6729930.1 helix-turn-helix transcriptional regulator [Enterobacter mori]EES0030192.1 helix-turn-helix transcriptional regulator [Escherichia coli]MBX8911110.1 helix-turn-helix transcriptional regulator [Enterobacter ludwigii]MCD9354848.1 AraC family transcriptional regulator [Klebsiella pneumoniae]MCD9375870.1 AraC family transcriptional regulator [Klebsiella pneumoniae]